MAREGEGGRELYGWGEGDAVSWFVPDPPFLEEPSMNLREYVGVGLWEVEAVGRVALGSQFCSGIKFVAHDSCITVCPTNLDC